MADAWSREENEAIVADYLAMLELELAGIPFNKAERNRQLQKVLNQRNRSSVELKHQNISAALITLGYPYIDGYKPRFNFQSMLFDVVSAQADAASALQRTIQEVVEEPIAEPEIDDVLSIVVEPPKGRNQAAGQAYVRSGPPQAARINWLEQEARRRSLGEAGERLVLRFEHERLWRAGHHGLANRVEHVSRTRGDGAGYDVLSFEASGKERLIEVKTTRFGAETPFFVSKNEVLVSQEHAHQYHLYRLFNFKQAAKLFQLAGSFENNCVLDPVQYSARLAERV